MKNLQDMFDTAHVRSYIDKSNEISPDTKKRIGARSKKLWQNDEYRNRIVNAIRKRAKQQWANMDPKKRNESISKMRQGVKQRWDDPEFRKMMSDKQRAGWEAKRKREGRSISKATLRARRVAAGDIKSRVKKKVSTPYGIFDSVMDMHRAKVCKLQPRSIRLRLYDDKFPDWKYI